MTISRNLSILAEGVSSSGVLGITNGGTGVTTSTGSGSNVLSASPTFSGTIIFPGSTTIDSSGNVGIGTSSPSTPLTVKSRASDNVGVRVLASPSNVGGIIQFTDDPVTVEYGSVISTPTYTLVNSATNLQIGTNGSERMRIDFSGNVGIGTSNPSYLLTVQTTSSGAGFQRNIVQRAGDQINFYRTSIVFNDSASASGAFASYAGGIYHEQGGGFGVSGGLTFATNNANAGPITFATVNTERMRIDSSGNVGIGTASPGYKLTVSGVAALGIASGVYGDYADMRLETATGRGWRMGTASNASTLGYFYIQGSTDNFVTSFINSLNIDTSGNVGIGTSSPDASAILDAQSTTKGVRFPNMTTTQKNAISSPAAGLVVFDTTLAKLCVYTGSAWQTITSV